MIRFLSCPWAGFLCVMGILAPVWADVVPGDVIDGSNWQKAADLLPESILNWVKNGDFVLTVGKLEYDQKDYFPPDVRRCWQENLGKYDLDEMDRLIDLKTGKVPDHVWGIPFPEIDPKDPKAAQKLLYNKNYCMFCVGNVTAPNQTKWVGRAGVEREISSVFLNSPMDGYEKTLSFPNLENIERYTLITVTQPYDVAGFAVLMWRYRDERADLNWSYVPAIRRVRRMSPANRSDAFVGSDFCIDDVWSYDGKINLMSWKLVGIQEGLLPYSSSKPELFVPTETGEWQTTPDVTPHVYGYQKEHWKGAPWAPANFVWVKRPIWILEAVPKDPYYNYGKQVFWCDPEIFNPAIKIIYDRAGAYWKTFYGSLGALGSADGKMRVHMVSMQNIVDDRSRHATLCEVASKRNIWTYFAVLDMNDFTLAGFQKYCK